MCRIFKKTIQIPTKPKEDEQNENAKKNLMWVSEEQVLGEDSSGIEVSRELETMDEKVLNHEHPKFPCDHASSSDLTQGTCTPTDNGIADDFQAQFACDEANSAANSYSMGIGYPSNLFQVINIFNI